MNNRLPRNDITDLALSILCLPIFITGLTYSVVTGRENPFS
ncbi:MAG TPA: hypothetical protein PLV72_02095 [Candidatus Magasanikbacteria bacterium]|nr:hypothetical protein [Candidatus Magasanikbacteria bacterium]